MKKFLKIFIFALFVMSFGFSSLVQAQNSDVKPMPEVLTRSEYILPYPGILPDHPLYFFKKIRDSVLEKIISDPVKKLEFYILQSDKELNSAVFLSSQEKRTYMNDAMGRSVQFKEKAFAIAKTYKESTKEIPGYIVERMSNSLQKQLDVLSDLASSSKSEGENLFSGWSVTVSKLKADVDMLK